MADTPRHGSRGSALTAFMVKELRHILRDRQTLLVLLLLPLAMVVLFGFALRSDVNDIRIVFVDPNPDYATTALRARFAGNGRFDVAGTAPTIATVEPLFRRGDADLAIVFEPGFAGHLAEGTPARLLLVSDASDPNTGTTMQAYASAVIAAYQAELGVPARGIRIVPVTRMRYNPTLASANLFVPGLIALVLTLVTALMTAISLSREKEQGTLEVLLVSPLRPWQIIVGKVAPYVIVGFVSVIGVIVEARLVFKVPLRGSPALLLVEGLLFILVSLSLGILISARTSSQRVAMMGALVGTMLPTLLLSGFIFPIESMPWPLRAISIVVPARWFVLVARSVMLKGVGLAYLWRATLVLLTMAAVLLVASTRAFHERLET